jgi:hypothetical protein
MRNAIPYGVFGLRNSLFSPCATLRASLRKRDSSLGSD